MMHAYNPSVLDVKEGGSQVQGQPELLSRLKTNLCYIARPCQSEY